MELSTLGKEKNRMSEWMIFAERLSEQIKKQNLSIRQLAERMDMTPTTIFRYAKGQRVPRANEILKASDALGVTCDYLVGLSDDPKKTSRPSVQPEPAIPISWLEKEIELLESRKNSFAVLDAMQLKTLIKRWRGEQNEAD